MIAFVGKIRKGTAQRCKGQDAARDSHHSIKGRPQIDRIAVFSVLGETDLTG